MATFTSTSGSYTTTLTVTQTSQSTQNNQSTLTYSLTLTKNSGTGLWNNNSCPWSITIDGSTVASGSFTYDFRSYSSLTLKGSTTTTVTHNSDGTKTVACSASVNMDNEPYVYVMKPSGDLALTTIPRASDVSVSNYSIANTSGSISATITSKASFYHKWRWRMNSGSWSSWTNKGLIASTSSTVTVANTTLLAQLPTTTSGSFNIEVATYSDSGYATLVGTKSASATVSVNTANIKPSVSLGNIGLNSTPISGYAVAGYSKVQSAWTTTNSSGASSVTTYLSTSHGTLGTTSSTSTSGTTVSGYIPSSSANYTLTISAYAKDSRGATSSTVSKSITVYGYTPPTATLNAYRVADSTSTTEDGAGIYAYVTFSGAVSASVNGQNSVQIISCSYWGSISGQATNGGHYALADTQTVTFQLTVTDKVTSSATQKTISTASYPLDLYDDGNGNVGVGIGTVAQSNSFRLGDKVWVGSNLNITGENKILWKEGGYAGSWPDSFAVSPHFTGSGDSNYLNIQGCVGEQGETPALNDFIHIYGQSGTISSILGNIWSGFSTASRECDIGASSVAGSIYFHSNGNQGTSGFRGIYGQNGSGTGQEVLLVGPDNEVRLGYHATFRCINTNTDTFTFYALPNLTNTGIYKYAIIYGGGSTTYFAYFVFFSTDNTSTFVPILFSSQLRTFTTTVDGNYLTFKANGTCWGGIRLIWIN